MFFFQMKSSAARIRNLLESDSVAVRIAERASRTNTKPISNLIRRRKKQTTTLPFKHFDRLQSYISV